MSNPFEKLKIKKEEDEDEEGEFQPVKGKEKSVPIGLEKKKKPRPAEKVENDKDEEGFTEVSKKTRKHRPEEDDGEESKGGEHRKRKGINFNTAEERDYREKDKPKRGRQFDRRSGTGRGKEISKGGAGGKGTWGENPKNIARDFENNNDDYFFDQALHPEKRKEKKDRPPKRTKKEDQKEGEEKEGEQKEGEEKKEEEKQNRRRFEPKPLTEEEKLKIPEGAQSLEEYLQKQKKTLESEEKKEVKRVKDGDPLKKREDKKDNIVGTSTTGRKKGKKKKEKEINKEELDLNAKIGANLMISGANERERRPRKGGNKKGNQENKFIFNEKDFPELNK